MWSCVRTILYYSESSFHTAVAYCLYVNVWCIYRMGIGTIKQWLHPMELLVPLLKNKLFITGYLVRKILSMLCEIASIDRIWFCPILYWTSFACCTACVEFNLWHFPLSPSTKTILRRFKNGFSGLTESVIFGFSMSH